MVLDNQVKLNSTITNLTKAEYLDSCDKALVLTATDWCNNVNENSTHLYNLEYVTTARFSKYMYERNLLDNIKFNAIINEMSKIKIILLGLLIVISLVLITQQVKAQTTQLKTYTESRRVLHFAISI